MSFYIQQKENIRRGHNYGRTLTEDGAPWDGALWDAGIGAAGLFREENRREGRTV